GGGDVKLFAAVGTWVGAYLAFLVLCLTVSVVALFVFFRLLRSLFSGDWKAVHKTFGAKQVKRPGTRPLQPRKRALGFSLPLAVATLLVLLWTFRVELHVAPAPVVTAAQVSHHDR